MRKITSLWLNLHIRMQVRTSSKSNQYSLLVRKGLDVDKKNSDYMVVHTVDLRDA